MVEASTTVTLHAFLLTFKKLKSSKFFKNNFVECFDFAFILICIV